MEPLENGDLPAELRPTSFGPDSALRWNWRDRRLYQITDNAMYGSRLANFGTFYDRFYAGLKSYDAAKFFATFELHEGRIGVAAFNSLFGNDCFAFHGAIPESAVAAAHLELRDRGHDLLVGVWHHNVDGSPYTIDYMDIDTVYRLIGKGFRLGLHGHQHRAQPEYRSIQLPEQESMALVSAGSLCAGARELPTGVNRQYNVVVLADDLASARVHVREVAVSTVFAAARRTQFGGASYVDLAWPVSNSSVARRVRTSAKLSDAEEAVRAGRYGYAVDLLAQIERTPGSYADVLLVDALRRGELWDRVEATLPNIATQNHLMLAVEAALQKGEPDDAERILAEHSAALGVTTPFARDLRARISAMRRMGS